MAIQEKQHKIQVCNKGVAMAGLSMILAIIIAALGFHFMHNMKNGHEKEHRYYCATNSHQLVWL